MSLARSTYFLTRYSPFLLSSIADVFEIVPNRFHVSVSNVTLSAVMGRSCWCYCTLGMRAFGQSEIVFILQSLQGVRLVDAKCASVVVPC